MTTIYDLPILGASPTGIDLGAFLLSHGGRCAPTVGYPPEASNGLLFIFPLTMSRTITGFNHRAEQIRKTKKATQ